MKIAAVLKVSVLLVALSISQQLVASQAYNLFLENSSLKSVAKEIKEKTGYVLLYDEAKIGVVDKITIHVENGGIHEILRQCLLGLPFTYTIADKVIVIKLKNEYDNKSFVYQSFEEKSFSGVVSDDSGNPLSGATVAVKNKKEAVTTGTGGRFILKNVGVGDVLVVSFVGFASKEVIVTSLRDFVIKLTPTLSTLDAVEIIAYGATTRRLTTGNSGSVKAVDIEKQPVNNPLLALQGRVAGVVVTQSTGLPGATLNVRIQGTNSLKSGNNPFYVVDGVPYASALLATSGRAQVWGEARGNLAADGSNVPSFANEGSGNPFSYLNPSDIESIEVLKDADATAIYGSRAANGAILITTKKGKIGKMHVDFNLKSGRQSIARKMTLLNATQYLEMRREAKRNNNEPITSTDYDLNGTWDTTKSTDWQDVAFGNSAGYFDGQMTVSGGNDNSNYLIGGSYNKQLSVLPGNFSDTKVSLHFSVRTSSLNQRFKLQLTGNYLVDNNTLPNSDPTSYIMYLSPVAPALYNSDGSRNWALNSNGISTWPSGHPYAILDNKFKVNVNNLVSSMVLSYALLPGLDIKANVGYTYMQSNELSTMPLTAREPVSRIDDFRQAVFKYNTMLSSIVEPQVNYRLNIKKSKLDVLVGATVQQNRNSGRALLGYGYVSDDMLESLSAAKAVLSEGEVASVYRYNAVFGRINYNYVDKYIVNLTARRDGSSRFGVDNRFHNFGSVGGAWIFSKESFIRLPKCMTFGKIKLSYGTTGNDQIGDYTYWDLYRPDPVGVPYQQIAALTVNGLFNRKLQWEKTTKMNTGIDLSFWDERILLGVNYALNRSSNLLQTAQMPSTAGFPSVVMNFPGTVQNTSLEFSLSTVNVKLNDFTWNTSFNLTVPKNELVSFPEKDKLTSFSYQLGGPLGARMVYRYGGVNPQTGLYMFKDVSGSLISNAFRADVTYVDILPKLYGGIENGFSYKGVHLDVSFQFMKQNAQRFLFNGNPGRMGFNQPVSVLNSWKRPGDNAVLRRLSTASMSNNITLTDAYYEDASFVRCKNASLSWTLPSKYVSSLKLSNCRVALQVQNLFTWTSYSGLDPESGGSALPPMRVVVLGIQAGF